MAAANAQIGVARRPSSRCSASPAPAASRARALGNWLKLASNFWSVAPAVAVSVVRRRPAPGGRRAGARRLRARRGASTATRVLVAFREVEDNLAALRILAEEAAVQDAAVDAAQRSLTLSTNRYQGGVATYLEVVIAQNAALPTQRAALAIRARQMAASACCSSRRSAAAGTRRARCGSHRRPAESWSPHRRSAGHGSLRLQSLAVLSGTRPTGCVHLPSKDRRSHVRHPARRPIFSANARLRGPLHFDRCARRGRQRVGVLRGPGPGNRRAARNRDDTRDARSSVCRATGRCEHDRHGVHACRRHDGGGDGHPGVARATGRSRERPARRVGRRLRLGVAGADRRAPAANHALTVIV